MIDKALLLIYQNNWQYSSPNHLKLNRFSPDWLHKLAKFNFFQSFETKSHGRGLLTQFLQLFSNLPSTFFSNTPGLESRDTCTCSETLCIKTHESKLWTMNLKTAKAQSSKTVFAVDFKFQNSHNTTIE